MNLSELRLFFVGSTTLLTGDFDNLLPNLKWLLLREYRDEENDPPSTNFTMKKLVILDLGNTRKEWSHMMKVCVYCSCHSSVIYSSLFFMFLF